MEKVLVGHEVLAVKKSRWEENDDIERYKILNDDQDILGIDESGKFYLMEDIYEYGDCDSVTCIFLDYDEAYDIALRYEQTEEFLLFQKEREKLYKKEIPQHFYDEDEVAMKF